MRSTATDIVRCLSEGNESRALTLINRLEDDESIQETYRILGRHFVNSFDPTCLETLDRKGISQARALIGLGVSYDLSQLLTKESAADPLSLLPLTNAVSYLSLSFGSASNEYETAAFDLSDTEIDGQSFLDAVENQESDKAQVLLESLLRQKGLEESLYLLLLASSFDRLSSGIKLSLSTRLAQMAIRDPDDPLPYLKASLRVTLCGRDFDLRDRVYARLSEGLVRWAVPHRTKPPRDIIYLADKLLEDDMEYIITEAIRSRFGLNDILDAIILIASSNILHSAADPETMVHFNYIHSARLALDLTQGRIVLPLFQAADFSRNYLGAERVMAESGPEVSPDEMKGLASTCLKKDYAEDDALLAEFCDAALREYQRLPAGIRGPLFAAVSEITRRGGS